MRSHRVKRSALQIAKVLWYVGQDRRLKGLAPAGSVELTERLLGAIGALPLWQMRMARRPGYRRWVAHTERLTVTGQILHIALRKRFLDDETRRELEAGARQVLVIGAGLDTLALRQAREHPEVAFVEIDHPPTQALKRRALERLGGRPPNLELAGVDLAERPLEQVLDELEVWDAERRSVVIAEGVLMYLEPSAVASFFEAAHRQTGPGSSVLFSYLRRDASGRMRVGRLPGLVRILAAAAGEPLRWAVRDGELAGFLGEHGWCYSDEPERYDLKARYLEPAALGARPLGRIELLAHARKIEQ